jgi:tryptophan 2,3-dioxygenase
MTTDQQLTCPLHETSSGEGVAAALGAVRAGDSGDVPQYVSYAHMDVLHGLQQPITDSPREMVFLLVSHVKELLFRVVYVELDYAREQLRADRIDAACLGLSRAAKAQQVLLDTWDLVSSMSPDEFLAFRHILGEASGTQSFMYRTLEFVLGNKDPRIVAACRDQLELYPSVRRELDSPSVYDEALRLLARRGLAIPERVLDRGVSEQYEADPDVESAWLAVYSEPGKWPVEHRIAEQLTEVAFRFSHWRSTHLLVVERMLGTKPGTGGTSGATWLREVNEHRFFPELWSVRTSL